VGWVRRLERHPVIAAALAAGELSQSWAKQVCAWTDRLPLTQQGDADEILAAAARGGVDLAGLAGLAQEMYERAHRDRDEGGDGGFGDRAVWLGTTLGGAGRMTGDLTAGCSAALTAVLDALSKRAGPEDLRTAAQRRHDALEEACRRLVASGMLPGRAGQPTQVIVHMTLAQLRDLPGGAAAEAAWAAARVAQPGWLTGPEAEAAACDATVVPIVTGHLDPAALDRLTESWLATHTPPPAADTAGPAPGQAGPADAAGQRDDAAGPARDAAGLDSAAGKRDGTAGKANPANATGDRGGVASQPRDTASPTRAAAEPNGTADHASAGAGATGAHGDGRSDCRCHRGARTRTGTGHLAPEPLSPHTRQRLRRALLGLATDTLSGPGGLAAQLRTRPGTGPGSGPLTTVSLPLDVGPATETIPAHLRRAVTTRHPHCAFPGCAQPATVCEIHHIIPRSRGGRTSWPT
jgi:hypothetical protein